MNKFVSFTLRISSFLVDYYLKILAKFSSVGINYFELEESFYSLNLASLNERKDITEHVRKVQERIYTDIYIQSRVNQSR